MYYIYCYTNKLNDHKYVGQTNNLQRRIRTRFNNNNEQNIINNKRAHIIL